MPMSFELTRREIREQLKSLDVNNVCHFDLSEKTRVRQVVTEFQTYTEMEFETSTRNKQLADKMLVRRIR